MNAVLAIAKKDLVQLTRDRVSCFFAFVFPLVVAIFFGTVFSGAGQGQGGKDDPDASKIDVLLVDEDRTEGSAAFAATLRDASELRVTDAPDRAGAADAVRKGEQTALIVLPKGFGESRDGMFWSGGSTIGLGVDPSRKAESGMLEGVLTKYGFMQMQQGFEHPERMREQVKRSQQRLMESSSDPVTKTVFGKFFGDLDTMLGAVSSISAEDDPGNQGSGGKQGSQSGPVKNAAGAWQPLKIESISISKSEPNSGEITPPNSFSLTFPQGIIWGVMGCALGFSASLVGERSSGTLLRLRVAPISAWQILLGKALACFVSTQVVSVLLLVIAATVFHVRPMSWGLTLAAIVSVGVCFVGIMMLLAVFSPSERGGNGLAWGVLLILSMIGGGMIPLFFMPGWMKNLSVISPIRWSVLALEGGIWRGFSPAEIIKPVAILLAIGIIGLLVGSRALGLSRKG